MCCLRNYIVTLFPSFSHGLTGNFEKREPKGIWENEGNFKEYFGYFSIIGLRYRIKLIHYLTPLLQLTSSSQAWNGSSGYRKTSNFNNLLIDKNHIVQFKSSEYIAAHHYHEYIALDKPSWQIWLQENKQLQQYYICKGISWSGY